MCKGRIGSSFGAEVLIYGYLHSYYTPILPLLISRLIELRNSLLSRHDSNMLILGGPASGVYANLAILGGLIADHKLPIPCCIQG